MTIQVKKFKRGDYVTINNLKLKVLEFDTIASRIIGINHYRCQIVGRRCRDSYPENRMKKV
jgi:hypothetical protein